MTMTFERAKEINGIVVQAYHYVYQIGDAECPDISRFTAEEAVEAVHIIQAHPGDPLPGGGVRLRSFVSPERIPALYRMMQFENASRRRVGSAAR